MHKMYLRRPMGERFQNVPNALSYTFVLLSGDYPIVNFTFLGPSQNPGPLPQLAFCTPPVCANFTAVLLRHVLCGSILYQKCGLSC